MSRWSNHGWNQVPNHQNNGGFSTTYWNPQYQNQMEQYYGSYGQPMDYGTAYPLSDRDSTPPPNYHQYGHSSNGYQMNGMVEGTDGGALSSTEDTDWITEFTISPASLTPPASSTSSSPKLETSHVQIAQQMAHSLSDRDSTPPNYHQYGNSSNGYQMNGMVEGSDAGVLSTDYTDWMTQNQIPPTSLTPPASSTSSSPRKVHVEVKTAEEWSKFDPENMEMRATADGRNLFPVIIFKVTGLQPDSFYRATLHLEPVDGCLLRFDRKIKKWVRDPKMKGPGATRTEAVWTKRMTGAEMMETLDWSRVKLFTVGNPKKTNEGKGKKKENKSKYADQMMKVELRYQYVPVLTIMNDDNEMATHQIFTSHYPQCQFIVASIYCTPSVIAMKKESTFSKFKTCKRTNLSA